MRRRGDGSPRRCAPRNDVKLRVLLVRHPEYGEYRAEGVADKLEAVQRAARAWGGAKGGLQWSKLARECQFEEGQGRGMDQKG